MDWDPGLYTSSHHFVFDYGHDLVSLLAPKAEERILDLGCGTGQLSATIANSGAVVVGLDSSPAMIEAAHSTYPEITFTLADATTFSVLEPFDAIFSNAALHWILDADAVADRIAQALCPGGRFVAELGGKGNVASLISGLEQALREVMGISIPHAWYFPALGEYASLLERHGLEVVQAALFNRPTQLQGGDRGLANWIAQFGVGMLAALSEECPRPCGSVS